MMPASLEDRVQRLEDEAAIRRLLVDYAETLDARDYAGYLEVFTPDGEWSDAQMAHRGRAAILAMLEETIGPSGAPNRTDYHLLSNAQIDVDGDRATARSRFLFLTRGPDGSPVPALAGIYHDDLVRVDGAWKIARRHDESFLPSAEEWQALLSSWANS